MASITAYLERKKRDQRFRLVLSPDTRAMSIWDLQMIVALLFLSVVTPFEVGFVPPPCGVLVPTDEGDGAPPLTGFAPRSLEARVANNISQFRELRAARNAT